MYLEVQYTSKNRLGDILLILFNPQTPTEQVTLNIAYLILFIFLSNYFSVYHYIIQNKVNHIFHLGCFGSLFYFYVS